MSNASGSRKSQTPSASGTILQKGSACLNCRRRKVRCDGRRPVCGSCASSDAFRDCEYTDTGATRTQSLEAQINMLQQRINELERVQQPSSALTLMQPYSESLSLTLPPSGQDNVPESLFQSILHTFIAQSGELGFFLNTSRFQTAALSSNTADHPSTALLSVAYLWGIHLSSPEIASAYESIFVKRAVELTAQGLTQNHPQAVLHCIQANVLLSNYFFRSQRILEGRYHANAAMSLVISSRLHMIRSSDPPYFDATLGLPSGLPRPSDPVEEGERINGFWTALSLNNCWTSADGTPSYLSYSTPDGRIDLPWPLSMREYEQNPFTSGLRSSRTVQRFLESQPDNSKSVLALYAKASILLEQASRIALKFRPGAPQQQFFASFNSLEQVILRFTIELPSIEAFSKLTSPSTTLLIYSVAHAAMIRLHAPFISRNPSSRNRIISSIRVIVQTLEVINVAHLPIVDSIMGIIWAMACQVLIEEISKDGRNAGNELIQLLNMVMTAMGRSRSPFIEAQLELITRMKADMK